MTPRPTVPGPRRTRRRRAAAAGLAAAATLAAPAAILPAAAQEEGGPVLTFGISTSLSVSDNRELDPESAGTTTLSETDLSVGFDSITRTQALRFAISDTFRTGDGPGAPAEPGFRGPNIALSYERFGLGSRLELSARQRIRDLDAELTEEDLDDPNAAIVDRGTLTTRSLGFALETGLDRPLGSALSFSETRRDYSDTTDPDLEDSRTRSGSLALILRPGPATETRLTYTRSEYEADDVQGTERDTRSLSLGATRSVGPDTTLSASIGWTVIEETWSALPADPPDETGFTASLGYLRDLPTGSLAIDLSHEVTTAGGWTQAGLTRAYDLPAGDIVLSLAAAFPENHDPEPAASLAWTAERPGHSLRLALSSNPGIDDDGDLRRTTAASIAYGYEINTRDSLGLSLSYGHVSGDAITDRTRATASASYSRNLPQDWTLTTALTHRFSQSQNQKNANDNKIEIILAKQFKWSP
ncbi:hypothetical protein [Pseudoruegeria sp. HB172150]|uniref:hypothetical protein n=1 Tax=Pseudoruegeria sp. HB172150 TaxID=2721164 RepID=UPI00155228ED|nr:hypothetical protein [Pseudoruegeria sp. HB172150]